MRLLALTLATTLVCTPCLADTADEQAKAFNTAYVALCLKHLTNLEGLRDSMSAQPRLPDEKASFFLQGKPGDAWLVPDNYGQVVLAIPADNRMCLLYARKIDAEKVMDGFRKLVSASPPPMVSRLLKDEAEETGTRAHTVSYEWSKKGTDIGMLFTMTTAKGDNAPLQALASAALVRD